MNEEKEHWIVASRSLTKITALILCVALLAPAASLAQSSSDKGYGGNNGPAAGIPAGTGTLNDNDSGNSPTASSGNSTPTQATRASGSSLPFTGADLGVLAVAGVALMGLGLGLRRLTHSPSQA